MKHILLSLAFCFTLLACTASLHAQGCSACKSNASQSSLQAQRGLRRGIAVLLVPSLILFSSLVFLAYKYRAGDLTDADTRER